MVDKVPNIDICERDDLCLKLSRTYEIPNKYKKVLARGIRENSTTNLTDKKIEEMVNSPQSALFQMLCSSDFAQFKGFVGEWLTCLEYNSDKNKGNVCLTMINPDSTSQADLLHIIKIRTGYMCVPGPDVKTGSTTYLLNQWEKCINRNITMLDPTGIISEPNLSKFTRGERTKLETLKKRNRNRLPLTSTYRGVVSLITWDLINYANSGLLPSKRVRSSEQIKQGRGKAIFKQAAQKIKSGTSAERSSWNEFHYKKVSTLDYIGSKEIHDLIVRTITEKENDKRSLVVGKPLFPLPKDQAAEKFVRKLNGLMCKSDVPQEMTKQRVQELVRSIIAPNIYGNPKYGIAMDASVGDPADTGLPVFDRNYHSTVAKPTILRGLLETAQESSECNILEDIFFDLGRDYHSTVAKPTILDKFFPTALQQESSRTISNTGTKVEPRKSPIEHTRAGHTRKCTIGPRNDPAKQQTVEIQVRSTTVNPKKKT